MYRWYSYQPGPHQLWGSWWIPTLSQVELYGSSTQECGVDRGDWSSDTFFWGIYIEKDFRWVIAPRRLCKEHWSSADYVRNTEVPTSLTSSLSRRWKKIPDAERNFLSRLFWRAYSMVQRILVRAFLVRPCVLVRIFLVSYLTFSLLDRVYSYAFSLLVICSVTCQKRR
jgi:hypothetical protein